MTKICCFSPCLEQVLKTVNALSTHGFADIVTYEVLTRTHEIVPPQYVPLGTVEDAVKRLKNSERHREERRALQMRNAREKAALKKLEEEGRLDATAADGDKGENRPAKRTKTDNEPFTSATAEPLSSGPSPPLLLSKPTPEMRGHTSYLTFARMYPLSIRKASEPTPVVAVPTTLAAAVPSREGTVETQFSSGGLDQAIGTMTDDELRALMAPTV